MFVPTLILMSCERGGEEREQGSGASDQGQASQDLARSPEPLTRDPSYDEPDRCGARRPSRAYLRMSRRRMMSR